MINKEEYPWLKEGLHVYFKWAFHKPNMGYHFSTLTHTEGDICKILEVLDEELLLILIDMGGFDSDYKIALTSNDLYMLEKYKEVDISFGDVMCTLSLSYVE